MLPWATIRPGAEAWGEEMCCYPRRVQTCDHTDLRVDTCASVGTGGHVEVERTLGRATLCTGRRTYKLPVASIIKGYQGPHSSFRLSGAGAHILIGH